MQSKLSYANCTARSHRSLQSHTTPAIQAARSTSVETKQLNIAVVGAGLAGCASVWHLLNLSSHRHPVQVHLFDAEGIAAGGSGAAAGLLHAYSSTGKASPLQ
jgi:predicted NAD/FAD-binding protein